MSMVLTKIPPNENLQQLTKDEAYVLLKNLDLHPEVKSSNVYKYLIK